jgi:hypothetical protein
MIQNKQTNVLLVFIFIFEKFENSMYRWNPTLHELQNIPYPSEC